MSTMDSVALLSDWSLDFSSGVPVYRQLMNLLYVAIGSGRLREGDRVPTIREMAEHFDINPNTVARAYRELDHKGVLAGRRGDGSYVSAASPPVALTPAQRQAKLDELFGRLISEAKALGISERELLVHTNERIRSDG
jgi:GntR family transcriptional regulator